MDEWMNEWMNGWMNEWTSHLFTMTHSAVSTWVKIFDPVFGFSTPTLYPLSDTARYVHLINVMYVNIQYKIFKKLIIVTVWYFQCIFFPYCFAFHYKNLQDPHTSSLIFCGLGVFLRVNNNKKTTNCPLNNIYGCLRLINMTISL